MLKGLPASSGIAIGSAYLMDKTIPLITKQYISDVQNELTRFNHALKKAKIQVEEIKQEAVRNVGVENSEIFDAHLLMLEDEELISAVVNKISDETVNAEFAVKTTIEAFIEIFNAMDNEYMRERGADVSDIGNRLLRILLNIETVELNSLKKACIVVAKDLSPSDTANMNKDNVLGFITQIGGRTSHSAIMARTLEIPALVGVGSEISTIKNGDILIVDGDNGVIIINPDGETLEKYSFMREALYKQKIELQTLVNKASITIDGHHIEIAANIGKSSDSDGAAANGAEGVGLFRTEFLYMNSETLPTEEEQYNAYREVLVKLNQKPVIIRTLDIGGDKKLPYLPIEEELNPFLGYRAIRLCLDRKDIFRTQLRALLRASSYGNLKIMFPMISGLEELRQAKAVLLDVEKELIAENIQIGKYEVGIMIEIPSAAIISDILAKEVDFFSIGTNDLIQYSIAVDRMNEKVSYLYNPYNLAFLRLIKMVIDNAHRNNKWVGMCGEVAGDPLLVPVLLGFGLDEFSMAASSILKSRKLVNSLKLIECEGLAKEILAMTENERIYQHLKNFNEELSKK